MYGTDTRSYNRSSEKRQMDKERHRFTVEYMKTVVPDSVPVEGNCRCWTRPDPHPWHHNEEALFEYQRSLRQDSPAPDGRRAMSAPPVPQRPPQPIQHEARSKRSPRGGK